jgi:hypothetical protein
MQKKTLVIGASTNPDRYSNRAIHALTNAGHEVFAIATKKGNVANIDFYVNERPVLKDLDTISLYINPTIQKDYQEYLISLKPKRIIFNPGTENPDLYPILKSNGIIVEEACTLVLLSLRQY